MPTFDIRGLIVPFLREDMTGPARTMTVLQHGDDTVKRSGPVLDDKP